MIKKLYNEFSIIGVLLSDVISDFGGSWSFIFSFLFVCSMYMLFNIKASNPFDPFPFTFLNLMLGFMASLQAPFILMAGDRQSAKDRQRIDKDISQDAKSHKKILELEQDIKEILEILKNK